MDAQQASKEEKRKREKGEKKKKRKEKEKKERLHLGHQQEIFLNGKGKRRSSSK